MLSAEILPIVLSINRNGYNFIGGNSFQIVLLSFWKGDWGSKFFPFSVVPFIEGMQRS